MKPKLIAYFLILSLFLGLSGVSSAAPEASEDTRYLVKSHSGIWKKSFGVRHEFNEGFTTDLNGLQLRVAQMFGVEVEPVKKFYVLPSEEVTESVEPVASPEVKPESKPEVPGDVQGRPAPSSTTRPIPSQQLPWGIKAVHNDPTLVATSGGAGVNVAVLDTGVLVTHPDLSRRIVMAQCRDFTSAKAPILEGKCEDKSGHGTHVSGTIAADGGADGKGVYGVAPEANLWAYKVCGANGSCWSDDIAAAITEAANKGANIISMSLGSDSQNQMIKDAITYAVGQNVLVIAAAGNDGPYPDSIDYPGANIDVVAVGAFDSSRNIAQFSSRGLNDTSEKYVVNERDIEFAAPGVNVESTYKDGGYAILSGTSMATPHIAGLAALLWHVGGIDSDLVARKDLHDLAVDMTPTGDDGSSGWGFPYLNQPNPSN